MPADIKALRAVVEALRPYWRHTHPTIDAAEAAIASYEAGRETGWRPRLEDIFAGFIDWSNKPHNAKWVRNIDGTPIGNDICVCIFERLKSAAPSPLQEPLLTKQDDKP